MSQQALVANSAPVQQGMDTFFNSNPKGMIVKTAKPWTLGRDILDVDFDAWNADTGDNVITPAGLEKKSELYLKENWQCGQGCSCRSCLGTCLLWDGQGLAVTLSNGEGGDKVGEFSKPCSCPTACPCLICTPDGGAICIPICCCVNLPSLSTQTSDGHEIRSELVFSCSCQPKYRYKENGKTIYYAQSGISGCCAGCCGRSGTLLLCDPETKEPITCKDGKNAKISKLTFPVEKKPEGTVDSMEKKLADAASACPKVLGVVFPDDISAERKRGLLGLTLLFDYTTALFDAA